MPTLPITDLSTYGRNPRRGDVEVICESLRELGQYRPLVVNKGTKTGRVNEILAGNHTYLAAKRLGWTEIDCHLVDYGETEAARVVLVDNRSADLGTYDDAALAELLGSLPDLTATGYTEDDLVNLAQGEPEAEEQGGDPASLAERFGVAPFTVLNTRDGGWQRRKKAWRALGLAGEEGRKYNLTYAASPSNVYSNYFVVKADAEKRVGHKVTLDELLTLPEAGRLSKITDGQTSVFDPVLTDLLIRWFSRQGDTILDPWAGGVTRAAVATALRRKYVGVDISKVQIDANKALLASITGNPLLAEITPAPEPLPEPEYLLGDSTKTIAALPSDTYDMVIGCPPYYDLEQYSNDPADMSNLPDTEFEAAIIANIQAVAHAMRPDSFACFVVGSSRGTDGLVRDMRVLFKRAADAAGLGYVNDAVLISCVGSTATRVGGQFTAARSLGRQHQDIVVYCKGDRKRAAKRLGAVDQVTLDALEAASEEQDDGSRGDGA